MNGAMVLRITSKEIQIKFFFLLYLTMFKNDNLNPITIMDIVI